MYSNSLYDVNFWERDHYRRYPYQYFPSMSYIDYYAFKNAYYGKYEWDMTNILYRDFYLPRRRLGHSRYSFLF